MSSPLHPAKRRSNRKLVRGFTLIELLTVITIIGILIAIIIPVVGAVRRASYTAKSAANLRQIGAAYFSYASDHKNRFPPVSASNDAIAPSAYNKGWDWFLMPYLFPLNSGQNLPRNGENLMMHPHDRRTDEANAGRRRTYSANPLATPADVRPLILSFVNPARLILVTERPCGNGTIGGRSFADVSPATQIRDIPGGFELNGGDKFNYLFADGHVGRHRLQDTIRTGTSYTNPAGKTYAGASDFNHWENR